MLAELRGFDPNKAAPWARPFLKFLIFFVCRTHVSAETCVVKTYSLVNGAGMRIMRYQHVFARHHSQEGR
jgi:hypothetical protein